MTSAMEEGRVVVETALRALGCAPDEALVSKPDTAPTWTVRRGSAKVVVGLVSREAQGGAVHLRVVAPVLVFAEERREELFHRLLELNAAGLSWCAFGIVNDSIVMVAERPTSSLDAEEVAETVRHVAGLADKFDDQLAAEYGGKRACDF